MNSQNILWIAMAAYAIHIMEEFFYNWKSWANNTLHLPVDWAGFFITNSVVLFFGIACATVGWNCFVFALLFPALMLINALFFHIIPVIITKKFSPGLFTAVLLFFPIGIYSFHLATLAGVTSKEIYGSFLGGILLMAYPIVLLKTKNFGFFKQ